MIFVGADVHVRNSFLEATDPQGARMARGRVSNTFAEMHAFCERILAEAGGEAQPLRVVLESTTNARPMQRMLRAAGEAVGFDDVAVDVLDARKLRIIAESVGKCDAVDARVLNQLARANLALPTCYMPDDDVFALREHLRARSDLVRMRTMIKNRIHAVLHRRGILSPAAGLFSKAGRRFLDDATLDDAGRTILTRFVGVLDQFNAWIAESDQDLRQQMRHPRWAKPAALLATMPGIGMITALTILAELGDLKRFKSRAAVANYAGLVPVIRDSNNKHYSGGITHRGSSHLRAVLSEAAWIAIRRVPVYTALFERVAARRGKQTAIVAVTRRMLEDAVRMLWKDEAFRFVPVTNGAATTGPNRHGTPCSDPSVPTAKAKVTEVASSVAG